MMTSSYEYMYVIFERDVWVLKMILEHNIYKDKLKRKHARLTLRTCRLGNVWKYTSLRYLSYSMTNQVHILEYSCQISREEKKRKVEKCSCHSERVFVRVPKPNDWPGSRGSTALACQVNLFRKFWSSESYVREDGGIYFLRHLITR